jgi:hypothetical protein
VDEQERRRHEVIEAVRVVAFGHLTLDSVMQAPGRADEDRRSQKYVASRTPEGALP